LGDTEVAQLGVRSGVTATWYLSTLYWELKNGDQLMVILKSSPTAEQAREKEVKGAGGGGPRIYTACELVQTCPINSVD
jgi:hypothetical protein